VTAKKVEDAVAEANAVNAAVLAADSAADRVVPAG
jgi:hypothetical protein